MTNRSADLRVWTINGDFVSLKPTGVARYAREVTLALDALVAAGHPLTAGLRLNIVTPRAPSDLPVRAIPVDVLPEFDRPRLPQFWVQAQLPRHVKGGLVSFCNLAPVAIRQHIVCIHDLHTRLMPASYGLGFRLAHRIVLPMLGQQARFIATVSQLSCEHLVRFGIAPLAKIFVTYNGSDHVKAWDADRSALALDEHDFVLCLAQPQQYKNMELIRRIAEPLDRLGLDICVAGDCNAALGIFGLSPPGNVRLLGRVSDDDLAKLLKHARAFLFPSRVEGFGVPAVEAMALGCPVVASTSPCLPEVCGSAVLYAPPDDANAWISAIERLSSDPALRKSMVDRGHARAQRYRWRDIAEIYLRVMATADANPNPKSQTIGASAHNSLKGP
jgi:glycosyltransferase involved in cell wall biosynthesis